MSKSKTTTIGSDKSVETNAKAEMSLPEQNNYEHINTHTQNYTYTYRYTYTCHDLTRVYDVSVYSHTITVHSEQQIWGNKYFIDVVYGTSQQQY